MAVRCCLVLEDIRRVLTCVQLQIQQLTDQLTHYLTIQPSACVLLYDYLIDIIAKVHVTQFFEVMSFVRDDVSRQT